MLTCIVFTFNHENFIEECIDSILMQKGVRDLRLVIFDNCSTDETVIRAKSALVRSAINYEVIQNSSNLFTMGLDFFWDAIRQIQTGYVRYLSGDDIFLDPMLFQRQIQFLEQNQNVVLCHSDFTVGTDSVEKGPHPALRSSIYSGRMLNFGNTVATLTAVFRADCFPPKNSKLLEHGTFEDYPLWLELSKTGKFAHVPITGAHLRIHQNNLWSNKTANSRHSETEDFEDFVMKTQIGKSSWIRKMISVFPRRLRPLLRFVAVHAWAPLWRKRYDYVV